MDKLDILRFGGIGVLVVLLVIFELTNRSPRRRQNSLKGYEYYTPDGSRVLIRHVFGSCFKVYVYGACPVMTGSDRYGDLFKVHARSASEAEYKVDQAYGS